MNEQLQNISVILLNKFDFCDILSLIYQNIAIKANSLFARCMIISARELPFFPTVKLLNTIKIKDISILVAIKLPIH